MQNVMTLLVLRIVSKPVKLRSPFQQYPNTYFVNHDNLLRCHSRYGIAYKTEP